MNIKLTKHASDYRLLRGISLAEIENNIATGIRSLDKLGILSKKDKLTLSYSVKDNTAIVKRMLLK